MHERILSLSVPLYYQSNSISLRFALALSPSDFVANMYMWVCVCVSQRVWAKVAVFPYRSAHALRFDVFVRCVLLFSPAYIQLQIDGLGYCSSSFNFITGERWHISICVCRRRFFLVRRELKTYRK